MHSFCLSYLGILSWIDNSDKLHWLPVHQKEGPLYQFFFFFYYSLKSTQKDAQEVAHQCTCCLPSHGLDHKPQMAQNYYCCDHKPVHLTFTCTPFSPTPSHRTPLRRAKDVWAWIGLPSRTCRCHHWRRFACYSILWTDAQA